MARIQKKNQSKKPRPEYQEAKEEVEALGEDFYKQLLHGLRNLTKTLIRKGHHKEAKQMLTLFKKAAKCPYCQRIDAYVGGGPSDIECTNPSCKAFSEKWLNELHPSSSTTELLEEIMPGLYLTAEPSPIDPSSYKLYFGSDDDFRVLPEHEGFAMPAVTDPTKWTVEICNFKGTPNETCNRRYIYLPDGGIKEIMEQIAHTPELVDNVKDEWTVQTAATKIRGLIKKAAACPGCGDPGAYIGGGPHDIECPNPECDYFSMRQMQDTMNQQDIVIGFEPEERWYYKFVKNFIDGYHKYIDQIVAQGGGDPSLHEDWAYFEDALYNGAFASLDEDDIKDAPISLKDQDGKPVNDDAVWDALDKKMEPHIRRLFQQSTEKYKQPQPQP